jgi:hypothetical protein
MARYRVRYVSYAAEQLRQMPRSLRAALDAKVDDLERDPYAAGDYDERRCSYSTAFSGGDEDGIILYMISEEIDAVTILRFFWAKL